MEKKENENKVLEKLGEIEVSLTTKFKNLEELIAPGKETFEFFRKGLASYKEQSIKEKVCEEKIPDFHKLHERTRQDRELRFPHRKIIELLAGAYDYQKGKFQELHFSKLVKDAKLGKNKAKEYLTFLIQKNYIEERTDGYRNFYRIKNPSNLS